MCAFNMVDLCIYFSKMESACDYVKYYFVVQYYFQSFYIMEYHIPYLFKSAFLMKYIKMHVLLLYTGLAHLFHAI